MRITDESESVRSLFLQDCFDGSLNDYRAQLQKINPEINFQCDRLPPYTAIMLPSEQQQYILPYDPKTTIRYVNTLSPADRQALRRLQENHQDPLPFIAMDDIMESFQKGTEIARSHFVENTPFFHGPFGLFESTTDEISFVTDVSGFMLDMTSFKMRNSFWKIGVEELHVLMIEQDVLHQKLATLTPFEQAKGTRRILEVQLREVRVQIKDLLGRKMESQVGLYLQKKFTFEETRLFLHKSQSAKAVRQGTLTTTKLDLMNRSGVNRAVAYANRLDKVRGGVEFVGKWAGRAGVVFDVNNAYNEALNLSVEETGQADYNKAVFAGAGAAAAGYVALQAGSWLAGYGATNLGAMALTTAFGVDIMSAVPVLACIPGVGWVAAASIAVVGIVFVAATSSAVQELASDVWNSFEDKGVKFMEDVENTMSDIAKSVSRAWDQGWSSLKAWYES